MHVEFTMSLSGNFSFSYHSLNSTCGCLEEEAIVS